ncbi:MAG: hypothetical protein ACLQI7_11395 [Streptosporangiaceae bacterium]
MPIVTSSHSGRPADVQLVALLKSAEQELETLTAARPAAKEQQHDRQQATGPDEGTEQLVVLARTYLILVRDAVALTVGDVVERVPGGGLLLATGG